MFDQNAANIIKQYSNFQLHNTNVRGELTQGENIADVGGVKISLQSLIHSNNIKLNKLKNKVLIITYYWPPYSGPGVQRWLKFVKYFLSLHLH